MKNITTTLIENFFSDINLLPIKSHVIKIDLCDHFVIELQLNVTSSSRFIMKQNFSTQNKLKFSPKLFSANWDLILAINNTDAAFNYSLKKLKKIIINHFPT